MPGLRRLHRNDGGENHGLAVGGEHGAVGLAGDLAGLEGERAAAPVDFDFVVIEHVLSFICGKGRAVSPCADAPSLASFLGQPRARQREARVNPARWPREHPAILPHDRPWAVPNGPLHARNRVGQSVPTGLAHDSENHGFREASRANSNFSERPLRVQGGRTALIPSLAPRTFRSDAPMRDRRALLGKPAGQFVNGADRASRSASDSARRPCA